MGAWRTTAARATAKDAENVPRSARGAPSGPRPAATCGRTTGARCRARPVPASMACCARPPRRVRARSSLVVGGVLPAPNPAFVSDDEGPIQECQTFHLDIASYCGLDGCPVTAPSPRCERDATRTKTQKQKKDAGNAPGPPTCAARGPWRRARSATTRRRRRARACAPPRACVEINASKGHEEQHHAGKRTSGSGRAPPRRSSS